MADLDRAIAAARDAVAEYAASPNILSAKCAHALSDLLAALDAAQGEAVAWPTGVLNRDETLRVLSEHNAWRRGAKGEQTDPRTLGLALDAVIAHLSAPQAPPARDETPIDIGGEPVPRWVVEYADALTTYHAERGGGSWAIGGVQSREQAPPAAVPTITREEAREGQKWKGMGGAIAYQLIERHAENWSDVGLMMDAWLEANTPAPPAAVPDAWVPLHPKIGPLWSMATAEPSTERMPSYALAPVYLQAPPAAVPQSPSYDALVIIAQSVCGALSRAGFDDLDDPGEAIDVMRERYERRIAELQAPPAAAPDWLPQPGEAECVGDAGPATDADFVDTPAAVPSFRERVSEIEDAVAAGKMTAAQCFTQMRQLVVAPPAAALTPDVLLDMAEPLRPLLHTPEHWRMVREYGGAVAAAAVQAPPAAVPAANVTPMRQPRADLARLVESINAAVYANGDGLSVTEAIGALELAKLELLKEQGQ